jgi:hypothetical protein
MKTSSKWILLSLALAVVGYFTWMVLTPQFGRVVGYANAQPPLQICQPANGSPPSDVEHIRQLAQLHIDYRPELRQFYWPAPSAIDEHERCWLITFTRKVPIYRWLGFSETVPPVDQVMFMTIEKPDETTRLGRWCQ